MNKTNPDSRKLDAYFTDEQSVINSQANTFGNYVADRIGVFKNRFTRLSANAETFETGTFDLVNKADPKSNSKLNTKSTKYIPNPIDPPFAGMTHSGDFGFAYYFSKEITDHIIEVKKNNKEWGDREVNLTLLFGPRNILNRSGVRSFFEGTKNFNAILQVPGVEPGYFEETDASGKLIKPGCKGRWGISLEEDDIKKVFKANFGIDIPFKIVVLAAYSTGTNGLNQTVLNDILTLKDIKRLIFYDCLYTSSSGMTADSIKKLKQLNPNIQVIIYWASTAISKEAQKKIDADNVYPKRINGGANSLTLPVKGRYELTVVKDLNPTLSYSGNVIKLEGNRFYRNLVCFRVIDAGIKEGFIKVREKDKEKLDKIRNWIPARGNIISSEILYRQFKKNLPPNSTTLDNLQKQYSNSFSGFFEYYIKKMHTMALLGWASAGGEMHDLLIPEFGWEYLPY